MVCSSQHILQDRLVKVEADFLSQVQHPNGADSLTSFYNDWVGLRDDIKDGIEKQTLGDDVAGFAFSAASRVELLAQSFLELQISIDDITAELLPDAEAILDEELGPLPHPSIPRTNLHNTEVPTRPVHRNPRVSSSTTRSGEQGSHSATAAGNRGFVPSSYASWLLAHVHNPYPSQAEKKSLAAESRSSPKALDDWFTNARRKIGWTAFSKRYFRSDRSLTLDCAHRVLIEDSGRGAYCEEIVRGMEETKATAERLYGGAVQHDSAEPSSFAKELEGIDAQTDTVNESRKRRLSTSSTISEQSSASCSSSSSGSSRKRSRDASEESDATSLSEVSDTRSIRPLKRSRSVASSLSSLSSAPSFTTCSSESNESFVEVITPVSSPTHSKLPLELFDGWIDGLSAEPAFLPHDLADKPPQSVLSHKRSSPDSDSDAPTKRARLEKPRASPIETCNVPISEPQPSDVAAQPGATAPSSSHSPPQVSAVQPPAGEAGSGQPMAELDEEALDRFISQLDFNIPQAPVPEWDETLLGSSLEASLFDFSSIEMESGLSSGLPDDLNALLASISVPDAPLSASEEALVALYAPQHDAQQECANEPKDAHLSTNPSVAADSTAEGLNASTQSPGSIPISLSSLDFVFLEGLDDAHPTAAHTSSPCNAQTPATLVDVSSSSEVDNLELDDPERTKKLERIDELLAEAQRLQQEVFG